MIRLVRLVVDMEVRTLCCRAYPGHRRGCPNYRKRAGCPPDGPLIVELLDLTEATWAVWVEFDIAAHREKMLRAHPGWSRRQADCCLYWQGGVLKRLRREVENFRELVEQSPLDMPLKTLYCPEAAGVNVTETMRRIGVELEWPPEKIVRKVAIVGKEARDD